MKSYLIKFANTATSYILSVFSPPSDACLDYHPNSLHTISYLHDLITSRTSMPLPTLHKLDAALTLIPYHYILFSSPPLNCITLAEAKKCDVFTAEDLVRIDLELGRYLRQLHVVQNDWFGLPLPSNKQPSEPSYSWQESFTLFIETVMSQLESHPRTDVTSGIPFEDIRRYLSRAIGFFLFDDVDVPSLIGFTLSDENVYVSFPSSSDLDCRITCILLPPRTLWADPMLETLFMPPGPSKALLEAYKDGEGPLIIFPRQHTKRLWYTLFLAFVILTDGLEGDSDIGKDSECWAKDIICDCVEKLKDAPYYWNTKFQRNILELRWDSLAILMTVITTLGGSLHASFHHQEGTRMEQACESHLRVMSLSASR